MKSLRLIAIVACLAGCAGFEEQYAAQQAAAAEKREQESQAIGSAVENYGGCLRREWNRALSAHYNHTNAYNFGLANCTLERDLVCLMVGSSACYSEMQAYVPLMFMQVTQSR